MTITSTEQAKGAVRVTYPILQTYTEFRATSDLASNFVRAAQTGPRHVGYGLPCAKCGTYYMADQSICPVCKCGERISPTTLPARASVNAQSLLDADGLEEEREPFAKKFKSQLVSAQGQINTATVRCTLEKNHQGGHEPAVIWRPCYHHRQ